MDSNRSLDPSAFKPQSFRDPPAASQLRLTVAHLLTAAASLVTLVPLRPRGDLAIQYLESFSVGFCNATLPG